MNMLPLDDPRWKDLDHRNWRHGKRAEWAPEAPFIPDELAKLAANPADFERFAQLCPWLCSEGTTYAAAYAAAPYFVRFAKELPANKRAEYLIVIGLFVTDSQPGGGEYLAIKDYLATSFNAAVEETLQMIGEILSVKHNVVDTRYLLSAAAALKGHRKLAQVLQNMDCVCGECPKCGEWVYPQELQEAYQ